MDRGRPVGGYQELTPGWVKCESCPGTCVWWQPFEEAELRRKVARGVMFCGNGLTGYAAQLGLSGRSIGKFLKGARLAHGTKLRIAAFYVRTEPRAAQMQVRLGGGRPQLTFGTP